MNVELNLEELDLILEALHDKHVACSESIDFLPKVREVNRLYNRLFELSDEHHKDNPDDGIADEDAIKLYNELVKSPEDRLALEKEIPSLIAARDKAVTAAKREQLQKETAQKRDQVAKIHR